jgi:hypothetical protein
MCHDSEPARPDSNNSVLTKTNSSITESLRQFVRSPADTGTTNEKPKCCENSKKTPIGLDQKSVLAFFSVYGSLILSLATPCSQWGHQGIEK